jgi:hypothetical protein
VGVAVRIYVSVLCADLLAVRHRVPRSNNHNESMRKIKKKIIKTRVLERNELVSVRTNHFGLHSQHHCEDLYGDLMNTIILSSVMNKSFIGAPKIMRKVKMALF